MSRLRELLLGHPLPTFKSGETRLDNVRALAALSPDALSSIAYANQEIYLGLLAAGWVGLNFSLPIALAIAALLAILTLSYAQTILAYPAGGGSYTVAKENLGRLPGLIAAAALLIDYVLTAAVSLTAGTAAIASAFPSLWPQRTALALVLLTIITVANLRGLRESGTLVAIPVYLFVFSYLAMIAYGLGRALIEGTGTLPAAALPATEPITVVLILHTFSSGCTALTGVEAISNGITIFKTPEARNARLTLAVMAVLMGVLLLGSIGLTQHFGVVAGSEETILSALARRIVGSGFPHVFIQVATLLILLVAANTSYVGFPRVSDLLAKDLYLPHQLSSLGDRLVFSNGIVLLSALVSVLIVIFGGDSHALIPLFAVGVFLAFTLSQIGMVIHWWRLRGSGWQWKLVFNGVGAITTAITLLVVAVSKFLDGAWIVALLIVVLVFAFRAVEHHYRLLRPQLSLSGLQPSIHPPPLQRVVLAMSGVHRGVIKALEFACSISDNVTVVYVELDPGKTDHIRQQWLIWGQGVPLVVVPSPYRSVVGPILDFLEQTDREHDDGQQAVLVMPEFIPRHGWQNLLHNQTAWMIRVALFYQRRKYGSGRVIIDVPFQLDR
ncbi:MAG: APC family permease [Anaerolineae bacterium]|nr:APC family permease [Anaerolineae bacterium]